MVTQQKEGNGDFQYKAKAKVTFTSEAPVEADCWLVGRYLMIQAEQTIKVPIHRIQKVEVHYEQIPKYADLSYREAGEVESARHAGIPSSRTLRLSYLDDLNHKQRLSMEMAHYDATSFDYAMRPAIGQMEKEIEENEAVIEEACQYLTRIGVEAMPVIRYTFNDIVGGIGTIAIRGMNLDALHLYSDVESIGPSASTRYYYIDYLVNLDLKRIGQQEAEKLYAHTIFKWGESIFNPAQRELRDLEWISGRDLGVISPLKKIFKIRPGSELTNALNSDSWLKTSLIHEFRMPWVIKIPWVEWSVSFAPIELKVDWVNNCIRVKLPKKTHSKESLPSILPSQEFMKALDRIANIIRSVVTKLERPVTSKPS